MAGPNGMNLRAAVNGGEAVSRLKWLRILAACVIASATASPALASSIVDATGQGSCRMADLIGPTACNNTDPSVFASYQALTYQASESNNWFSFEIPDADIISGTLKIELGQHFVSRPELVYSIYNPSTISFSGLSSGPVLGSISLADIKAAEGFVSIALNGSAISLLNNSSGESLVFGGDITGSPYYNLLFNGITGRSGAQLILETNNSAVPEPSTWALFLLGFGLVGGVMRTTRRRQKASVSHA